MYVQWADRCGMHLERLDAQDGAHLLAVSGLGCGEILRAESGVHVLEPVDEERDGSPVVDRDQVHVVVVARLPHAGSGSDDVVHATRTAIAGAGAPSVIVRRYRPGKAPLVRDSVRGYRTGRLERVLAGDFDLY
jgi:ATP-dependent Clp protease ATP-binding subunit ClpC